MKNIVVAGHIDHGKTTLISALSNVFKSQRINYSENPMQISRTETKITFSGESYLFFDYPGDTDYKNNLNGSEDAAILVIAATDGPMPGTKKAIQLCKELGIKKIIVFLNNCDMVDDEELVDLIEYDSVDSGNLRQELDHRLVQHRFDLGLEDLLHHERNGDELVRLNLLERLHKGARGRGLAQPVD